MVPCRTMAAVASGSRAAAVAVAVATGPRAVAVAVAVATRPASGVEALAVAAAVAGLAASTGSARRARPSPAGGGLRLHVRKQVTLHYVSNITLDVSNITLHVTNTLHVTLHLHDCVEARAS